MSNQIHCVVSLALCSFKVFIEWKLKESYFTKKKKNMERLVLGELYYKWVKYVWSRIQLSCDSYN